MQFTDDEIDRLRTSFDRLRQTMASQDPFGRVFYDRLFAKLPEARGLFRDDLAEQGMRFLTTLGVIVNTLDDPAEFERTLEALGAGHRAYGVTAAAYAPMGAALRETMADWLGDRYDAETDAAWARAYAAVSERMLAAAPAGPAAPA
ncbi:globin family protein [Paralimibaculum aggregatum]|uniref:Globin family protein n=1 Tax=Paralimibaculum aggregatum TaxID=3036245 RepID=A0ABQ6LGV7_9RHOB|nr:globin domain-containing protein [Limibaculum sp. NKW23]GMG81656.1 globin family protein [Limibaculum sp. NKW23]